MWEPIKGPDAVQTPAEVYASLAREGLAVRYLRVPVTDGKAPQPCDIDEIVKQVGVRPARLHVWHGSLVFSPHQEDGTVTRMLVCQLKVLL
jgi:hypothetical protein